MYFLHNISLCPIKFPQVLTRPNGQNLHYIKTINRFSSNRSLTSINGSSNVVSLYPWGTCKYMKKLNWIEWNIVQLTFNDISMGLLHFLNFSKKKCSYEHVSPRSVISDLEAPKGLWNYHNWGKISRGWCGQSQCYPQFRRSVCLKLRYLGQIPHSRVVLFESLLSIGRNSLQVPHTLSCRFK